jgi:tetratricopeptide (TPR) repeat protein
MNTSPRARLVTLLLLLWITPAYAPAADYTGSKTVIGRTNTLLAEGARALEAGHFEEGVRLTLDGLKAAIDAHENAIGHSNACAGYVRLKQWADALAHCNAALELDRSNWHTYNNRAAIYIQQGLFELGKRDLEAALALAPDAPLLHESLRILEIDKHVASSGARRVVTS